MKTLLASWLYLSISLSLLFSTQLLAADLKITIEGIVEQEGGITDVRTRRAQGFIPSEK